MKITAQLKLNPNAKQHKLLLDTLIKANSVCNVISQYCFKNKVFGKFNIQYDIYHSIKSEYNLSAQIIVRCISKVAYAYLKDKNIKRKFKTFGSIAYDSRILSFKTIRKEISIWTVEGRQTISYSIGEHQKRMLQFQQGESKLAYVNGTFYLLTICDIPDEERGTFNEVIGVDFGIENIATTSDGENYTGSKIEAVRQWYSNRRAKLQSVGTKSAKRRLKKLSGKESKFKKNENHIISKQIVKVAKDTNRAIALENLTHIRTRTTVRKKQRAKHSSWAFNQLRLFITYKSQLNGVPVLLVNPKYTSQRCNGCGHIERANRKSQSDFVCNNCGHSDNADLNGAKNIQLLGLSQKAYGSEFCFNKTQLQTRIHLG